LVETFFANLDLPDAGATIAAGVSFSLGVFVSWVWETGRSSVIVPSLYIIPKQRVHLNLLRGGNGASHVLVPRTQRKKKISLTNLRPRMRVRTKYLMPILRIGYVV